MVNTRRTVSVATPEPAVSAPPSPPQGIAPRDIENEEQEVYAYILRLEKLKADCERFATLQAELAGLILLVYPLPTEGGPPYIPDRPNRDNDIKIEDIPIFNNRFSIQKCYQWLVNLELTFQAAPNCYSDESKRILGALRFMDVLYRVKWSEFLGEKVPEDRRIVSNA